MPDYSEPRRSTKRVRFFDGQALEAQDFIDEQNFHVSRQRTMLASLLGPGVLEGLGARFSDDGTSITVQAGVAVDNAGRILVVPGDQTIELDDEQQRTRDELGVWISYRREHDTISGSIDTADRGGNTVAHGVHDAIEPDRFIERPVLSVQPLPSDLRGRDRPESLAKLVGGQDIVRAPKGNEDLDAPMPIAIADDEGEHFYSFPANLRNRLLDGLFDRVAELEQKLEHLSVRERNGHPTMEFSGVNVMVTNGSGSTDNANGLGNLIVGYNEGDIRWESAADEGEGESDAAAPEVEPIRVRTGSHNLVVGMEHSYPGSAGVIFGKQNEIHGGSASVLGGERNVAKELSSVLGGIGNTATNWGSVAGGTENKADNAGSVLGGISNTATINGSVAGGSENKADNAGSVLGGESNTATTIGSVAGGIKNHAEQHGSVLGGNSNSTTTAGSVSGGTNNQADSGGSVLGGDQNRAGDTGSVAGGTKNQANEYGSVLGGDQNHATTTGSVAGGTNNQANLYGSILGGDENRATNTGSVAGGLKKQADKEGSVLGI